ncbi:MAG: S-layer homology domain-containing protein [Clostridia bacterium]|nr:S-layer homology domain-containing protein [Clostridia bacterium]
MKKAVAILLFVLMTLSSISIIASADSINPSGHTPEGVNVTVKKVDASVLKKDGVISEGEYEKADIDVDEDNTFLHVPFSNSEALELGLEMLKYMEFYFSWSDGQINVAVKSKPAEIKQVIPVDEEGPYPKDDFCRNVAFTISSDVKQTRDKGKVCNFYFAVCRRTDTDELQLGYYADDQRGNSDSYLPVAGEDFTVAYDGDYAILEWSIPFSEICEGGTADAGDCVYLSVGAEAGSGNSAESETYYGVSLGDFTYGVAQKSSFNHAAFLLSDEPVPQPGPAIVFDDVPAGEYYAAPVNWAVAKGITTGTSSTTFSPEDPCTRGQVVTFLWRAAGSPKPASSTNPFTDVKAGEYYYDAVLWAVEKGVTTGTSKTTFSPEDPCTRGQIVTFICRYAGGSDPGATNPFGDVKADDYFYVPVMWAVANKITTGTTPTTFGPEETCTRAQVVTFLYRYAG